MKRIAILVSLIALALPASAGPLVNSSYLIPSAANTQGNFNAYFKTKVTFFNTNTVALSLVVALGTQNGRITRILLIPASTFFTYENFLDEVFGYTGGGSILVTGSSTFGLNAEVYVDGPNGRYSTPLQLVSTSEDQVAGSAESGRSTAFGVHAEAGNRVNFGCTNLGVVPATVRAVVHTFTPTGTATVNMDLGAQSWQQVASPVAGDKMYVDFSVMAGGDGNPSHGVYCYAVNVNNASNDGTLILAERLP